MADSQEIYIRNPSVVLNVHLCGMYAPKLLKAVFTLDIVECSTDPSVRDRKVNGSLSKVTVTLANCPVILANLVTVTKL